MRVLLAGATGAIGRRLVPLLVADGHEVTGLTRTGARAEELRAIGATSVTCDALDAAAVTSAVEAAAPEALIHQLTAIPQRIDPRRFERDFALTDRLRTEGTANLLAACGGVGTRRILAQSIAFNYAPGPPGTLHGEEDPLLPDAQAAKGFRRTSGAVRELERAVLGAGGLALRYGYFYGPGSSIAREGSMATDLRRRRMPVVGGGTGVWSFIHVDDAARATLAALTRGEPAPYNIVDDDPAPVTDWLPALAQALEAPRPMRVPALLARPLAGAQGVAVMTRSQGASNARAKRELRWAPRYASWREGFRDALG